MRLSRGWVEGERLICPYHSWSYSCTGQASSPGTPKLTGEIPAFDLIERYGALWIKNSDSQAEFPNLEVDGYQYISTLSHRIQSPLEVVLDNFSEVEHTASVHTFLGYGRQQLSEIETRTQVSDNSVKVSNKGRQKPLARWLEILLNIHTGDWFCDNWTTYFTPVHIIKATLEGLTLGRFDRALLENRKRIDCIYRGRTPL